MTRAITALSPVRFAELPHADTVNADLLAAFEREKTAGTARYTHSFLGRFENTYIDAESLPELTPVLEFASTCAREVLGKNRLRHGFWFNEMQPGHSTSLHSHKELDELLSAVYYVSCPPDSGRLVLHDDAARVLVEPRPGLLVMFPPDLPHEVEKNTSTATRLSVAFNFGPYSAT